MNFKILHKFDSTGYFAGQCTFQVLEGVFAPENTTETPLPEDADHNANFYKWDGEVWQEVKKPTCAADLLGVVVSHESQTAHDQEMRALVQKLGNEDGYRIQRGTDQSWFVEEIPLPTVEELKATKLSELESSFLSYRESKKTWTQSSLGFKVNANSTAYMDVDGLVGILSAQRSAGFEDATVAFMDFEKIPHDLTEAQLLTIKNEIAMNGTRAYGLKWTLREQINAAQSGEELDAVIINFDPVE